MQMLGYLIVAGEKIKILARTHSIYVSFKIRHSGKDGNYFLDESVFLNENPKKLKELKEGKVINL